MVTGIVGMFGIGNYGNEASLAALLDAYRERDRINEIIVVCENPDTVTAEHGVAAAPLWSKRRGGLRGKIRDVSHLWLATWQLDAVIVPGTGILEGQWVQAGGLPLALFIVAAVTWLRRRPMTLLSIGVDDNGSRATRLLFSAVLHLASTVTVRDNRSKKSAARLGRHVEIYPDLVLRAPAPPETHRHPVIALGVMDYTGLGLADDPDERRAYEQRIDDLVHAVRARGYDIEILAGAAPDLDVARGVVARAGEHPGPPVRLTAARTYDDLVTALAGVQVTIASRYHNVLASLAARTPVVALGYGPKHVALANEFELPGGFSIADFRPLEVASAACLLADDLGARERIAARMVTIHDPLEKQLAHALTVRRRPRGRPTRAGAVTS